MELKPEVFLYLYLAGCVAVLLFNIIYIFYAKYQGIKLEENSTRLWSIIMEQMERLEHGCQVEEQHLLWLTKRLKKIRQMKVYEKAMGCVKAQIKGEIYRLYVIEVRRVFLQLTDTYRKHDEIEKAYFCRMIEVLQIDQGHRTYDGIMEFLVQMSIHKSAFVRENALKALYAIGNQEAVVSVWEKMNDNEIHHSSRLLADGLLAFSGDKEALAHVMLAHTDVFCADLIRPVLQFIRYTSGKFREEFQTLFQKENLEKELKLECIRYFRKYPYEPMRQHLQKLVEYHGYIDWEYAAVAAIALSQYEGEDTVMYLKEGLKAKNWYIRLNCASALMNGLKITPVKLYDIYNGKDRYAREILKYVQEQCNIVNQEMELSEWCMNG